MFITKVRLKLVIRFLPYRTSSLTPILFLNYNCILKYNKFITFVRNQIQLMKFIHENVKKYSNVFKEENEEEKCILKFKTGSWIERYVK